MQVVKLSRYNIDYIVVLMLGFFRVAVYIYIYIYIYITDIYIYITDIYIYL
jgi:hypothetical protein